MARKSDTREKMVASAALMLRERGLSGTSFARVIAAADAPRGSIGHHFPAGKEEMIADAVSWAGAFATAPMRAALERGDSAAELFATVCDIYRRALTNTDFKAGCPVGNVAQEGHDDPRLRVAAIGVFEDWRAVLRASLTRDGHTPDEAIDLADLCIASIEGALILCRAERSTAPLDRVERRLLPPLRAGPSG